MDPFLKWAGGKRWLARALTWPANSSFRRYVEPFLGSGAIFFKLAPKKALLSDVNAEVIELFEVMKTNPGVLRRAMELHQRRHNQQHYYAVRAAVPSDTVHRAARTLYLNRTCWNGLYRVNRRGEFNVPIGTKTLVVDPEEDFESYAAVLSKATLRQCDFEDTVDRCADGDFLFVDPPYTVRHNKNGFLKYNESIFSWDDQVRLHAALVRAALRGAKIMVTNADHESLRELYATGFEYVSLTRSSVLAGSSLHRGATSEALFAANLEIEHEPLLWPVTAKLPVVTKSR